jgi:hypothetical protein
MDRVEFLLPELPSIKGEHEVPTGLEIINDNNPKGGCISWDETILKGGPTWR